MNEQREQQVKDQALTLGWEWDEHLLKFKKMGRRGYIFRGWLSMVSLLKIRRMI